MTATRTLVVSCPDWPVTAAGVPADIAAAVVFANRVVAASVAARAEGVRVGLRRREAQSRCPGLVVIERDPGQEARAFEPVVMAVETFGPKVEVSHAGRLRHSDPGPGSVLRWGGGSGRPDRRGRVGCDRRAGAGRTATSRDCPYWGVGVADGRFAATLAAGRGAIVAPAQSAAFLADFPVAVLERPGRAREAGPTTQLTDLLARLGIRTLEPAGRLADGGRAGSLRARGSRGPASGARSRRAPLGRSGSTSGPGRLGGARSAGRSGRHGGLRSEDARPGPARASGPTGVGLSPGAHRSRDRARRAPEPTLVSRRPFAPCRHRRAGALAARRLAERHRRRQADGRAHPAAAVAGRGRPRPGKAAGLLGRRGGGRRANGPRPGPRAGPAGTGGGGHCGPGRGPQPGRAGAAGAVGRAPPRRLAQRQHHRGPAGCRLRHLPSSTDGRWSPRWSTATAAPSR